MNSEKRASLGRTYVFRPGNNDVFPRRAAYFVKRPFGVHYGMIPGSGRGHTSQPFMRFQSPARQIQCQCDRTGRSHRIEPPTQKEDVYLLAMITAREMSSSTLRFPHWELSMTIAAGHA
jgi:hypothetical protein